MSTGLASLSPQISDEFAKIRISLAVTEPKSNSSLPDDPLVVKGLARLRGCDHKVLPELYGGKFNKIAKKWQILLFSK